MHSIIAFRKLMYLVSFYALLITNPLSVEGQSYDHSIGVRLSNFLSISYTQPINERFDIEGLVGITQRFNSAEPTIGLMVSTAANKVFNSDVLSLYIGAGPIYSFGRNDLGNIFRLSGLLGMNYQLKEQPYLFFIDFMPFIRINDKTDFDVFASLGARYLF